MRRRGLVHTGAWLAATTAAVTLSWFGVHTVLAGTVYDPPRTLPVSGEGDASETEPESSSTHRPKPSPTTLPPPPTTSPPSPDKEKDEDDGRDEKNDEAGSPRAPSTPPSERTPPRGGAERTSEIQGATVRGGRAVFDVRKDTASLVSATPEAGWDMQVWESPQWIRVTFRNGEAASSIICRWDHSEPRIEAFDS